MTVNGGWNPPLSLGELTVARYSGVVAKTPSLTVNNWAYETVAGDVGRILEVTAGGEATASTAMRTRWNRVSAVGTGARTAGDVQQLQISAPSNTHFFTTAYATTEGTLAAGDLLSFSWNCHGGLIRWLAAPGEEWIAIAVEGISCRNAVGIGVSTYGVIWEEDF